MTHCTTQLQFPFFQPANLTATFDGGCLVSDAGLLLVREFDQRIRFTDSLARLFPDPRNPVILVHPQVELIRQRLYQILAGYEDCNDATVLRQDPLFKLIAGRPPDTHPLASQPTLSRLENRMSHHLLLDVVDHLVDVFVQTRPAPLREITLDVDPSEAPTYGNQQLTFFNGHYDSYMYFPQFICDAQSRFLLAPILRPGNVAATDGAVLLLARVIQRLRFHWPHLRIYVRADSSFAEPNLLNWLEEQSIPFVIGIGENDVLKRLSAPFVATVEARYAATHQPQRSFTSFSYQTQKTWPHPRRIVVKVEVTSLGTNVRYLIAGRAGRRVDLFAWYAQRGGTIEDAIEQLKNGFEGDRMSCHSFAANAFRLVLHATAYNLMLLFREHVAVPELERADMQTIRLKLIKVGARVRQTVRRVWVELSSSWPFAQIFRKVHAVLVSSPSS